MRRIAGIAVAVAAALAASCGAREPEPRVVQPGAPGEATREVDAGAARTASSYTPADVAFMRAMIPHHAQALVMAALVPDRTTREPMRLLAERIEASQEAEIAQMRRWLEARGEPVPETGPAGHGAHGMHGGAAGGAPAGAHGMATPEQLAALEAARGTAFDRLFLELMIRHHEGALAMTRALLATEGAAREPELYQLISHIDADQRAEIARMRRMLDALQ